MDLNNEIGILLGNSINSRAYMVYITYTKTVTECINIVVDENLDEKEFLNDEDGVSL